MLSKALFQLNSLSKSVRFLMSQTNLMHKRQRQVNLAHKIKEGLNPIFVKVDDISIGSNSCGQMYNITVESQLFKGKSLVQQHKMVAACISSELKDIHGYNLKTTTGEIKQAKELSAEDKKKKIQQQQRND